MKSSKIRLALLVGLVLVLAGLSVWAFKIAPVAASSVAGAQSKGQPTSQTKAQADVVATGLVFKQAVAAYQANPSPENAAAVEKARAAYDQAIIVRVAEISDRLAQLFPKASFSHADYGKKPEGPPAAAERIRSFAHRAAIVRPACLGAEHS